MASDSDRPETKRTDVGYKRPPVETQFKKGQKPPPRKTKTSPAMAAKEILWKVLQERRRVTIDRQTCWLSNAELVVRRALLEADKGSTVLRRLLNQLILDADIAADEMMPDVIIEPD